MYSAIQGGMELPDELSEEEYLHIRNNKDENKALTGFVGFGCSFAGKWFGGYARNRDNHNYCKGSKNSLMDKMSTMQDVKFVWRDYKTLNPNGLLIYCDPPYKGTTKYTGTPEFSSEDFWNKMREWSINNDVYISEYSAPDDFECVLEIPTRTNIRDKSGGVSERVDKLFTYKAKDKCK